MPAATRVPIGVAALVLCALGISGCTMSESPTTQSPQPAEHLGATSDPDARLRDAAPDGLLIGAAVAGGGHHVNAGYPDPFPNDEPYRELLATEFSSLTPENQLKWEFVHPERDRYDFAPADAIVDFAEQHGQAVRGHTLLWHSQNPDWLTSGPFTDEELREILHDHIQTVVGRYAGRIAQWDVANELFTDTGALRPENPWVSRLGIGIVADAFRWAHEADPEAVLVLNDYGIESAGPKADAVLALARQLLAEGVPLGGIGVQGHLSLRYPQPTAVAENLDRFAALGLTIAVTEADVRIPLSGSPTKTQLAQQAQWFGELLAACRATGACSSFTVWGVGDHYSWVPSAFPDEGAATPWWDDFARKPAYDALLAALAVR